MAKTIDQKYEEVKGILGNPTSAETTCPDGIGRFRHYQYGSIYKASPVTEPYEIHGSNRDKWAKLGWETGFLGYPTTDETTTPDGIGKFNHFQGGSIYWTPQLGAFEIHGTIRDKWAKLGWETGFLGYPTTDEITTPDGIGKFNHFQGGSIYWTPQLGAFEIHGTIRDKWAKLGWETGFLGYPTTDECNSSAQDGKYQHFQGGTMYWFPGQKEAYEVHGAIKSKWGQFDWEFGLLGFPLTDETPTWDKIGRFNHFQNGSIYWKPTISAHEIYGSIKKYWADNNWESNPNLGYPISGELDTKKGSKNRYNDFENGVLVWEQKTDKVTPLQKTTGSVAGIITSRTGNEVVQEMTSVISDLLKKVNNPSSTKVKKGPYLAGVTDYSFDGTTVHNRKYIIQVDLGVINTSNLKLWFEMFYYRNTGKINAILTDYSISSHVSILTGGVDATAIENDFKKVLNVECGKIQKVIAIPPTMNVLSIKTMKNGDLNVYVDPLA